jgi:hypothetical protein
VKAGDYERKWKKKLGPAVENPNSVDWDKIAEIEKRTLMVRPPGCITTREYADHHKISIDRASSNLARMTKLGRFKKIQISGSCKVYWQPITK